MGKIIINNVSKATDEQAIDIVLKVIRLGRISNNDKQYCYVSEGIVRDVTGEFRICIISSLNKNSDSFRVIDGKGDD